MTLNYSKWDWHGGPYDTIFNREKEDFPIFDKALTALVEDLDVRGLLDDTLILTWGEFGRTPKISDIVGRDHWPRVACALTGRRWNPQWPGHRRNRPSRWRSNGTSGDIPGGLCDALSTFGNRCSQHNNPGPARPPAISGRCRSQGDSRTCAETPAANLTRPLYDVNVTLLAKFFSMRGSGTSHIAATKT